MDQGEYSAPLPNGNEVYLIKVIEKKPSAIPPFQECKDKVFKELKQSRLTKLAQSQAQQKRAEIIETIQKENLSFAGAAKKVKLLAQKYPPF